MTAPFDPALTSQVNTTLGPLFTVPITSPVAADKFAAVGFDRDDFGERYFAFRSAPLGRATAETVIATYFNFAPRRIRKYIPRVWDIAEPEVVLDVLMDSVDATMGDALREHAGTPELLELAALLSDASAAAFARPEGRPLFAGIAGIPWPDAPHSQVWLGMHALREFRGDGHIAALASRGLTGIEALVLHAGTGMFPPDLLRSSRNWPRADWDACVEDLRSRGLITPDEVLLTDAGTAYREAIETQTDELAMPAYAGVGEQGVTRILELAPPIVKAVTKGAGRLTAEQVRNALPDEG
jgi:Helix-turn-helix family